MGNPIEEGGVNVSIKNHIASIQFHHPLSNSLPGKVLQELAKTITEMGNNDEVTVIILQSAGERAFCAGASFDELISEGNVALMRSVEKFNFALGNRFSTYATYAIQRHFFRISHKSRQHRNRFASDDEPINDRAEEVSDHESCSPDQVRYLKTLFSKFLHSLETREQQIVLARFGFDGDKPKTFRQLGTEMGVCKERIRQIQTRAIAKLRTMAEEANLERTIGDWL